MMKRILLALLASIMAASLASCGGEPLFSPIGENSSPESSLTTDASLPSQPEPSLESSSQPDPSSLIGSPIPESSPADRNYLDDAIFIGDSLTEGLAAYEVLPREQVLADTGINPQTILTKACIEQDGTEKTVTDAAASLEPGKIYLMLGANGVAFLKFDDIIGWYGELIDTLQADHPDAVFYLQSVLPVTRGKELEQENLTNERIRELNGKIQELAAEKGCYYLNVAEAIADEDGYLPDDLSADGMHFGVSTYNRWIDYLLCHTVEGALE